MSLIFNIRHLERKNLLLQGELSPATLEIEQVDDLIRVTQPLSYDVEVQRLANAILVRGTLALRLECECARCLKPFVHRIALDNWTCHLPLEGEEAVPVVNDCVDLTPYLREDMLLSFPQHPLCQPECSGLKQKPAQPSPCDSGSSAWAVLDKLKL